MLILSYFLRHIGLQRCTANSTRIIFVYLLKILPHNCFKIPKRYWCQVYNPLKIQWKKIDTGKSQLLTWYFLKLHLTSSWGSKEVLQGIPGPISNATQMLELSRVSSWAYFCHFDYLLRPWGIRVWDTLFTFRENRVTSIRSKEKLFKKWDSTKLGVWRERESPQDKVDVARGEHLHAKDEYRGTNGS